MTNFIETKTTASKELQWLINNAKVVKEYPGECIERRFEGRLPYRMAMKAIKDNKWGDISEGGQGQNQWWCARSLNAGMSFYPKTGKVQFSYTEAI